MSKQAGSALISVYDKTGIEAIARDLIGLGITHIYASAGTARVLHKAKISATDVAELSGRKPMVGHQVVTLTPEVHAGLMARTAEHREEVTEAGFPLFDVVIVDLYPLNKTIAQPNVTEEEVVDKTDVGGVAILRAAAKGRRVVVSSMDQWPEVLRWLKAGQPDGKAFRRMLAFRAEFAAAAYSMASAQYLGGMEMHGFLGLKAAGLSYGENHWQGGTAVYMRPDSTNPLAFSRYEQLSGPELGYNNAVEFAERMTQTITHIAAGFEHNFGEVPAIAIGVKHGNVCGASYSQDRAEAIRKMLEGDERAIFGGSVMFNFELDQKLADLLVSHHMAEGTKRLLDVVVAASATKEAQKILSNRKKLRLLVNPALAKLGMNSLDTAQRFRYIPDGVVTQDNYTFVPHLKRDADIQVGGRVSAKQQHDLVLAWAVGSTSNSNTITLVKNGMVIGNGVGQQDRVGAAELAITRARGAGHESLEGAVAYSDSFFPFPDGPTTLISQGVRVILTSSGSVNDQKVFKGLSKTEVQSVLTLPDKVARGFFGH